MFARKFDWLPLAAAVGIFGLLLVRPLDIVRLRGRMRRESPEAWAQLPTNGRFRLLLPYFTTNRYHDEALYASGVHEILRHGRPYSAYWPEKRGPDSWVQSSLGLYVIAGVAAVCGGDLNVAWCLTVALLGAAWFLLFYRVFLWWSGRKAVAYPLALFSILFPDFYEWLLDVNFNPRVSWERYVGVFFQHQAEIRPNFYRLPSYFLSMFLLSWLFIGAWRLAGQKTRRPVLAMLLGLGFGLMAWVHTFEFAFGMSTLMFFTVSAWLTPATRERKLNFALASFVSLIVGGLCSAAVSMTATKQAWEDHLALLSGSASHTFYRITIVHLIFAAFGFWMWRKEADERRRTAWLILICAQLGVFCLRNAQVLVGYSVMPFHYIPPGSFMGCLMIFLFAAETLARRSWWKPSLAAGLCLLFAAWGLTNELLAAQKTYRMLGLPRDADAALDWTNAHVPPDSTILSLSMMSNLYIPLYTSSYSAGGSLIAMTNPFALSEYLEKIARLLKTSHADVDAFLAERWILPGARAELTAARVREERLVGSIDTAKPEAGEWFASYLPRLNDEGGVLEARREFKELVARARPLKPPYYLWVNAADAHLLSRPPETFGGERVFQNGGVSLYRFAAPAEVPQLSPR